MIPYITFKMYEKIQNKIEKASIDDLSSIKGDLRVLFALAKERSKQLKINDKGECDV